MSGISLTGLSPILDELLVKYSLLLPLVKLTYLKIRHHILPNLKPHSQMLGQFKCFLHLTAKSGEMISLYFVELAQQIQLHFSSSFLLYVKFHLKLHDIFFVNQELVISYFPKFYSPSNQYPCITIILFVSVRF